MQKWRKTLTKIRNYYPEVQALNHVVATCKLALREGRYTWRHNSILLNLTMIIKNKVETPTCRLTGLPFPNDDYRRRITLPGYGYL